MKLNVPIIIVCSLLVTVIQAKTQQVPKIRIDPAQAYGGTVSDYFEEVDYIPLQTTTESLFGTVMSLVITDSCFIISDHDTHAILFFKKDGRYIKKLKFKNDEYPNLSYEKSMNRIMVTTYDNSVKKLNISYYSIEGDKQGKSVNVNWDEYKGQILSMGGGYFFNTASCYFPPGKTPVDSIFYAINIYKDDSLFKRFLPYNQAKTPCLCALAYEPRVTETSVDSVVYVAMPFENDIYRLTKGTMQKIYTIVFPFDRLLAKDLLETTDLKRIDSLRNNLHKQQNIISGVSNIHFENNLLLFKLDQRGYIITDGTEAEKQYNLIYNLKTERLISLERITPDEKSHFLPLIGGVFMSVRGLTSKDGYFYGNVPSLRLFQAKESTKDKQSLYPPVLQQYFKTQNRKSNPVIVKMKLKEQ